MTEGFSTIAGISTAILIVIFLGIVAWAYSSRRRDDFAAAAQLPLLKDDEVSP